MPSRFTFAENVPESVPEGAWMEFQLNDPFMVVDRTGIYRYRYTFVNDSGQTRIVVFGGRRPSHLLEIATDELQSIPPSDMEMVRLASQRGQVSLDSYIKVTLLAWDVNRSKAKIIKASGAVLTVNKDRLQLLQGETPNASQTMDSRGHSPDAHSNDRTRITE